MLRMMGPDLVKDRPSCALTPVQTKAPLCCNKTLWRLELRVVGGM